MQNAKIQNASCHRRTNVLNIIHRKPKTEERCAVRERAEETSPGDFVAVHSLAVSVENTLKGRCQHFVQGCMETEGEKQKKRKE